MPCFFMVSGLDFARAPHRAPLTARNKGSGYENGYEADTFSYPGSSTCVEFKTPSSDRDVFNCLT